MILNSHFSFKRIFNLLKKEVYEQRFNLLKLIIVLSGILIFFSFIWGALLSSNGGTPENHYDRFFFIYLVIIGAFFASIAFNDIHNQNKNQAYLMLPASTEEKFFIKIFSGIILYPLAIFAVLLISGILSEYVINRALFDLKNTVFNPFRAKVGNTFLIYLMVQSFFFHGSAAFKKTSFVGSFLTFLALLLIVTVAFNVIIQSISVLFPYLQLVSNSSTSSAATGVGNIPSVSQMFDVMGDTGDKLRFFMKVIIPGIFIPTNYLIAYFKLREVQLHHSA